MVNVQDPGSFPDSKLITCILNDDGRDSGLLRGLRAEKGVITANSFKCRGVSGSSAGGKSGKKLEVKAVRVVTVVVAAEVVDEMFEYIYDKAELHEEDAGFMYQSDLIGATPFVLPEGIPDEVED
jgi:hypothetical protein